MTKYIYDKCDDFSFRIVNFLFICANIPSAPAYGVYISQPVTHPFLMEIFVIFMFKIDEEWQIMSDHPFLLRNPTDTPPFQSIWTPSLYFLYCARLLTIRLLEQGYVEIEVITTEVSGSS